MKPLRIEILEALKDLCNSFASAPFSQNYGLCMAVCERMNDRFDWGTSRIYDELEKIAEGWPEHSGVSKYPIPCTNKKYAGPMHQYDTTYQGQKWRGQQGRLRKSLALYMLNKLEREYTRHNEEVAV